MAKARVAIDATGLSARGKGISRYLVELLPELAALDLPFEVSVFARSGVSLPAGAESMPVIRVNGVPAIRWEQLEMPQACHRHGISLVHTTTDRVPVVPYPPISLYLFEDPRHRHAFARAESTGRERIADLVTAVLYPLSLRRAAMVLVSSKATAADLDRRGIDRSRVRVVYPGVAVAFRPASPHERRETRARLGAPDGYVLHFSSDDPRDNTDLALAAYAAHHSQPQGLPLFIAGPVSKVLDHQRHLAAQLGVLERVRWLGYQSGQALIDAYGGACAYLDTTMFEGFGFHVAEGLACGVPVICTNTSSLPELVGDAAILVPANDTAAFTAALDTVLSPTGPSERMRTSGPQRAAMFNWQRTAEETAAAWEAIHAR